MSDKPNNLARFWQELKRRKVVRVIIVYAAAAFVILEAVDIITPALLLPSWTVTFVIVLLAIGFPIAIIFSWIFDITPKGIKKTEPVELTKEQREDYPQTDKISRFENSIAVLPFQDMSPQKDQEYFCDGMTEEIINALTHVESLKVIARTSSFAFKDKHVDIREIGKKLDVETLVEGSIRKAGNRLRITAQLIKVADGSHLWSERYDRELEDIFDIQDEISLAIVENLKVKLLAKEKKALLKRYTDNNEVYNFYLLGRYHNYKFTEDDAEKSKQYFEESIKLDPEYAPAYAGLCLLYVVLGGGGLNVLPPKEAIPKAKAACKKALEIDPDNVEAHCHVSFIYNMYEWNWKAAEDHIKFAVELDPNNAEAHRFYAWHLTFQGRHEKAIIEIKKSIELDPLVPLSYQNASAHYYFARKYDTAIEYGERALKLNPNFEVVNINLGMAYIQKGMINKAIDVLEKMTSYPGISETYLGYSYGKIGKTEDAKRMLDELKTYWKSGFVSASGLAIVHLGLGDREEAVNLLESSLYEKPAFSWHTAFIKVDPIWDSLRNEPRFNVVMKKIGLEK